MIQFLFQIYVYVYSFCQICVFISLVVGSVVFGGIYFIMRNLVYCIDWNIITLNGRSAITTFLFDWMSQLFTGFVFIIYCLDILYSEDYVSCFLMMQCRYRVCVCVCMYVCMYVCL